MRNTMTKKLTLQSILLALGLVLNLSVQLFSVSGMKVDFVVIMMAIAIIKSTSYKESLMIGFAYGLLTALTTTFPYGQVANLVDKIVVAQTIYFIKATFKIKLSDKVKLIAYGLFTTLLSGSIFLIIALSMANTLNIFTFLFVSVVIPSSIGNSIMIYILAKLLNQLNY